LDDVIEPRSSGKGGKEGGKGKGSWERGGSSNGRRETTGKEAKLSMSLDEVIENTGGQWDRWSSKGKGKGKDKGDSWGWGKSSGKGDRGPPRWQQPSRGADGFDGPWAGGYNDYGGSSSSWRMEGSWEQRERSPRGGERGGMRSAGGERFNERRPRGKDERSYGHVNRIKVTNVPRDLGARDIKHAFEAEAGKTTSCELDGKRGVAYLTFAFPEDARKAVETFDRGELNGKTITVTLEP